MKEVLPEKKFKKDKLAKMCGVTGFINLKEAQQHKAMTDAITHRGPDGEGHWIENNVGLGHRRLAIVDLSDAGAQPMVSADHRYILTFNGEIYNFKELREELRKAGYWFRSDSDSEVVLNALSEWGDDALERFNGMFALGFWDRKNQTLTLARDRYGIKPLYYVETDARISFASESKALRKTPVLIGFWIKRLYWSILHSKTYLPKKL